MVATINCKCFVFKEVLDASTAFQHDVKDMQMKINSVDGAEVGLKLFKGTSFSSRWKIRIYCFRTSALDDHLV
jgi:hypothetical protein